MKVKSTCSFINQSTITRSFMFRMLVIHQFEREERVDESFVFQRLLLSVSEEEILLAVGGHGGFIPKKPIIVRHQPFLLITYQTATPCEAGTEETFRYCSFFN